MYICLVPACAGTVVATKSGVELFYASSVNSSDCIEGSSFQVSASTCLEYRDRILFYGNEVVGASLLNEVVGGSLLNESKAS